MYRMPEKQTWSQTVLKCPRSCFRQYANNAHPFHETEISSLFYCFSICFVSFCIISVKAWFFHVKLCFQKKKNFEETLHLQPRWWSVIRVYFAYIIHLYNSLICKLPLIRRISLETKMSPFISQMFVHCLFWPSRFLSFTSDFSFQRFNGGTQPENSSKPLKK